MKTQSLPVLASLFCALALPALAADWPQWRGPDRSSVSRETGLLKAWPKDGPPLLWTYSDAGTGYSGPVIVGGRLYSAGAQGDQENVYALEVGSGKPLWSTPIGPVFTEGHADGPRSSPTVDGELLYVLGGQGELVCVETATGKKRWSVNLKRDLSGQMMSGWGYSESPLVDGAKVVVSPGGSGGTLAALDKHSGQVIWRSKGLTDRAAYSSMIVAEVSGVRQYIQMTEKGVAGVAAPDGRLLWRYVREGYRTAVIPTPLVHDQHVYVTAGYGAGCDLLRLIPQGGGSKAEQVYANKNMVNHHGGVVLVGEHVYGYSDSERGWVCQDFKTGQIIWTEKAKLGKGSITCADGHLYCYSENNGTLVLIEASPQGWREQGRFKIPRETTQRKPSGRIWTHPVVADGRLYLRDQDLLFAFDVKERTARAR